MIIIIIIIIIIQINGQLTSKENMADNVGLDTSFKVR